MKIQKPKISDAREIQAIVNTFAKRETMLPLSLNELYENIRDFWVCKNLDGQVVGVCALKVLWENLAEIRSLAVVDNFQMKGIGKELVKTSLKEAKKLGINKVFALTYQTEFFKKLGFEEIEKAKLPQKIWTDCLKCHKFPECDETAVIINLQIIF